MGLDAYGVIRKATLFTKVPLGVLSFTSPVVAPFGTVVLISEFDTTTLVPLKVTSVELLRFVRRMITAFPTLPEVGLVSTNGPRPTDRVKAVPQP
jgi:hypothetical protein